MRSKICLLLLLVMSSVIADETVEKPATPQEVKQEYGYFSAGLGPFPIPLPAFAGGYRAQSGPHGVDLSLHVQTAFIATQLKANLIYLHYFKPSFCSQFYVGGVGPSISFGHRWIGLKGNGVSISPEFVFGKQYRNETEDLRFFQMQVSFSTVGFEGSHVYVYESLLVIISYGIGF